MKTLKQLLWFIVPTVVIVILIYLIFTINTSANSFVSNQSYLKLLLNDPIFLKALLNTFILFEIYILITIIISFVVLLLTKKLSNKIKLFIAGICCAISIYLIFILFKNGDIYGTIYGLLLRFHILKEPAKIFSPEIHPIIPIFVVLPIIFLTLFLLLTKSSIKIISNKKYLNYFVVAVVSFVGLLFYNYTTTALTGYPSTNYASYTIVSHIADYSKISFFNNINILQMLIILQITVINCFLFWCVEKIIDKLKKTV